MRSKAMQLHDENIRVAEADSSTVTILLSTRVRCSEEVTTDDDDALGIEKLYLMLLSFAANSI